MPAPAIITERFDKFPAHPLARPYALGGANGMANGDIVRFMNGRPMRLDEALSDGDALVTLADGTHDTVKWNNLQPWAAE